MIEQIISTALISTMTLLFTYIVGKKVMKNAINEAEERIFSYLDSEEGQKILFKIGAMVGNGIKSGIGITSRGGKFKWQDLAAQIAAKWLGLASSEEQKPLIPLQENL